MEVLSKQKEPVLKDCIAELVRTEYCAPCSVFNVRKIIESTINSPDGMLKAFKLLLSDGKKMIPAVLVAEMHWFVITEVVIGAYIMVNRYKYGKATRKNKPGLVAFIEIQDFHVIGYMKGSNPNEVVAGVGAMEQDQPTPENGGRHGRDQDSDGDLRPAKKMKQSYDPSEVMKDKKTFSSILQTPKEGAGDSGKSGNRDFNNTESNDDNKSFLNHSNKATISKSASAEQSFVSSELTALPFRVYQRKLVEHWHRCHRLPFLQRQSVYSSAPAKLITHREIDGPESIDDLTDEMVNGLYPLACGSLSQYAIHEIEAGRSVKRIETPLDVITLKSLRGLANRQGRICDILAFIEEITPEVVTGPLGPKREVKLSDPTTLKRVLLSVFVEPIHFTPSVGTLCLFRNLRNHKWDGASLNAYRGDCEGKDWYIPNPEFAFPKAKIDWMRGWWEERTKRRRENYGCEVAESDDEYGYPAEKKPPRETVFGASDSEDD